MLSIHHVLLSIKSTRSHSKRMQSRHLEMFSICTSDSYDIWAFIDISLALSRSRSCRTVDRGQGRQRVMWWWCERAAAAVAGSQHYWRVLRARANWVNILAVTLTLGAPSSGGARDSTSPHLNKET